MIWPTDGLRLALTKVKTRRVRLGITLFISSLLFVVLSSILFTVRGVVGTVEDFNAEGFGARYIVAASPVPSGIDPFLDPTVIARAKVLHKEYVAKRKSEAKRLGIPYDETTEQPAVDQFDGPTGKVENLSSTAPASKQALSEYYQTNPLAAQEQLKVDASSYGYVDSYSSVTIPYTETRPYFHVLDDGKEDFSSLNQMDSDPSQWLALENFSNTWQGFSSDLLNTFLLPEQTLERSDDGSIPILAPYSALEKVLGLEALPKTANAEQKLERLKELRAKAAGYTFQVCYRNSTSVDRINQAKSQQDDLERNKTNKNYVKPELMYTLPTMGCGDVGIARDVRSAETKKQDAKQEEFRRIFGEQPVSTSTLSFRIVGIVSDGGGFSASTAQDIIQSILTSSVGNGWFSPKEVIEADPLLRGVFKIDSAYELAPQYYVELDSAENGKAFLEERTCNPDYSVLVMDPAAISNAPNPFAQCAAEGKSFSLVSFGSNSLALDEFNKGFDRFFRIFVIIIMTIASLIMMGIVSRIIADSRRETAVFRAIGAKRMDIAQIYVTYVFILCVFIALIATVGGVGVGKYLQSRYGADMQVETSIAFNTADLNREFSFSRVMVSDLVTIWGLVLAVGGISSLLPLFSNLKRNPIKDMRDER